MLLAAAHLVDLAGAHLQAVAYALGLAASGITSEKRGASSGGVRPFERLVFTTRAADLELKPSGIKRFPSGHT